MDGSSNPTSGDASQNEPPQETKGDQTENASKSNHGEATPDESQSTTVNSQNNDNDNTSVEITSSGLTYKETECETSLSGDCSAMDTSSAVEAENTCLADGISTSATATADTTSNDKSVAHAQQDSSQHTAEDASSSVPKMLVPEPVDIKVIFNKKKYDVTIDMKETVLNLKAQIETLTGVPIATQKVMYKGSTQDSQTMVDLKVTKNAKFMVVGSSLNDLLQVTATDVSAVKAEQAKAEAATKETFCKQTVHKKVLDKYGKPDDAAAAYKDARHPLPPTPLSGMYNKAGSKTRLTFKLDQDELWIGTKERTQKIRMASIKNIISEPLEGHEEYHIMGIQLGPTEASRYWVYWVPAQYINAIKDTVLGKWDFF